MHVGAVPVAATAHSTGGVRYPPHRVAGPGGLIQEGDEVAGATAVPQTQVRREVIRDQVGVTARLRGANWTHNFKSGHGVISCHMFMQG